MVIYIRTSSLISFQNCGYGPLLWLGGLFLIHIEKNLKFERIKIFLIEHVVQFWTCTTRTSLGPKLCMITT
jgi:hypothetical protein